MNAKMSSGLLDILSGFIRATAKILCSASTGGWSSTALSLSSVMCVCTISVIPAEVRRTYNGSTCLLDNETSFILSANGKLCTHDSKGQSLVGPG